MINTIQYELFIEAHDCNPNGDPQNGGAPRQDMDGYGVISPVCLKRKFRKAASAIVACNPDKYDASCYGIYFDESDGCSKEEKMKKYTGEDKKKSKTVDPDVNKRAWEGASKEHWDCRVFGNLINCGGAQAIQRGTAISVSMARSLEPVEVYQMQITSAVPFTEKDNGKETGKMGCINYIKKGLYKVNICISPRACERNGVTEKDLELFEEAMKNMFVDDASLTRPIGQISVAHITKVIHPSPLSAFFPVVSVKDGEFVVDEERISARNCTFETIV